MALTTQILAQRLEEAAEPIGEEHFAIPRTLLASLYEEACLTATELPRFLNRHCY